MSDTIATYSFFPWLRQGLINSVLKGDNDPMVHLRASIKVDLKITPTHPDGQPGTAAPVSQTVELYGPGDIVGIDSKAIIKTEPRNWITNFENNFLPYVDFYEEDFPWRYTPARDNVNRLRPWITLVVLKEDEFEDGQNIKDKPLPFFKMKEGKKATELFPLPMELWAWAHVHVNKDLSGGIPDATTADANTVNAAITELIQKKPDEAYSRLLCPRKLEPNVAYHAFVIPSFESGRIAGLGWDLPNDLMATKSAWETDNSIEFPYYYRWYFRTGNVGDFEHLVTLLKPKPADKRVGVRDMDVLHPESNLPAISNPDLLGVLKLGGALRVPFDSMLPPDQAEVKKYDEWDESPYPHEFSKAMASRINLADDYADAAKNIADVNLALGFASENNSTLGDPDPVVTSPLYGQWHAMQQRLLKDKNDIDLPHNKNWVHELNLDPRFRVAAGLGTKVIQKGQEEYMQAAWEQVGKVTEVNYKIHWTLLATEVSNKLYSKHFAGLSTGKVVAMTAPVQKRIIYQNVTTFKTLSDSVVPPAVTTAAFRSVVRPRSRMMKQLNLPIADSVEKLVEKINDGHVIVAPPKIDPPGAVNLSSAGAAVPAHNVPNGIADLLKKYKWFKYLPLIILFLLIIIVLLFFRTVAGAAFVAVAGAGLVWLYRKFKEYEKELSKSDSVLQTSQTPEKVDEYPSSSNFVISTPESGFTPTAGGTDSVEAASFKRALKDAFTLVNIRFPEPERKKLQLADFTTHVITNLNPRVTIRKRTFGTLFIPERIKNNMVEEFAPVMIYPEIDVPMYKPLADLSSELFLPNINLIEQNSITLLENNQKFIESYMVGVNHEMSRELLWREFPTDQRGSYFRQFWDVSSFLPSQPVPDNIKETLRDIPRIHEWSRINTDKVDPSKPNSPLKNELGQHNLRALESGKTQLVLVIRGELLKKYPTAVIYAHKADWGLNKSKVKDVKEERRFIELSDAEKANPPKDKLKTPLFEAKVDPDIYFFGFDLDDEEARGTLNPTSTANNPGWFFVIKERPGEPRFGLDIDKATNDDGVERRITWNDLSWKDIEMEDGKCIELDRTVKLQDYNAAEDQENVAIDDDKQAKWNPDTHAGELAYILYQVPVLVGVHASRMLPK